MTGGTERKQKMQHLKQYWYLYLRDEDVLRINLYTSMGAKAETAGDITYIRDTLSGKIVSYLMRGFAAKGETERYPALPSDFPYTYEQMMKAAQRATAEHTFGA